MFVSVSGSPYPDLTSRESSAFTIQQSVQVDAIKNPVEKKAKKQPAYWRKNLMPAGDQHIQGVRKTVPCPSS